MRSYGSFSVSQSIIAAIPKDGDILANKLANNIQFAVFMVI